MVKRKRIQDFEITKYNFGVKFIKKKKKFGVIFCPCNWNYDFIDVFVLEYIYIYICIFFRKKIFFLTKQNNNWFCYGCVFKIHKPSFPPQKKKKKKKKKKSYNLLWLLRYHILHSNHFS